MNGQKNGRHTISLFVSNRPGVLNRTALVFSRRGFNIDSLVVSASHDPDFSHMTICASGDEKVLAQILNQLNKLVDVVHARDNTGQDVIERELALIKIRCPTGKRTELLDIATAFKGQIMDLSENSVTFQVTGRTEKLDAATRMLEPYGIIDLVRTGKVLIARGDALT
jgi:acetolactate synthase I/III small subunit